MLLFPKKPKFFKSFSKKNIKNNLNRNENILKFSKIGLVSNEAGFIPNFQMEAIRVILRRFLKKKLKYSSDFFPIYQLQRNPMKYD